MFHGFLVGSEKGGVEDRVKFPLSRNLEMEGHAEDDFFHFKGASSFHLELFGSIHVEIGCFKPDLVPYLPWSELGGYLLLHYLLGHLVGYLGVISGGRQVRVLTF